jgi:hypothetical protein
MFWEAVVEDNSFQSELEIFRTEEEIAQQYFFAHFVGSKPLSRERGRTQHDEQEPVILDNCSSCHVAVHIRGFRTYL